MAIKIDTVKQRVKHVLLTRPDAKDCDQKLFALILYQELVEKSKSDAGLNPKILIAETFLKIMSMNEMTNFESVRRVRALLQACPDDCNCEIAKTECKAQKYRGEKWEERKGYEENVKQEVIGFTEECQHIWIPIKDPEYSSYCRKCIIKK